jgi:predicted ATPase/transcriptional regulator with XRE-family HTH domain
MPESISFGTWLRRKRRALDLTQKALADQVGCAEITVRRMEADEYKPSNELALVLFEKLGIPEPERTQWVRFARGLAEYPNNQITSSPPREQKPNLPIPLTSFIGREKEIETVKQLIAPRGGGRLLTLTGAGGSGKTRLALEVAASLHDIFSGGIWFIDFAPLTNPTLVLQSLLTTLGLSEQVGRSTLDIVSDFLQPKRALLIFDNCEHLIDACAHLAETLLRSCPTLHILATSREALSAAGERRYLVPTLTSPDPAEADLDTLPKYEAVRLFVERAQTALPGFRLTADNTLAIAQVCHQLDGIPLALELAAARVKALRVEQIAARLEDRFRLLISGARTALPRHQTLHALIDWSYNLLSEDERLVLQRLSVFAGGCTLEAAEAVCVGVEADNVLDLMIQLVNKSLLISEREQGQEARYRMLETIHQYARRRLIEAGEGERIRSRHFEFFLQRAEQIEPHVRGPQLPAYLNQLETEHDNLRAALEWSLSQAERGEDSLRLASALFSFWDQRGYLGEGRTWLARTLTSPAAPSAGAARAKALYGAGCLAYAEGDFTSARTLLEISVALWRALGSAGLIGLAHTLSSLGQVVRGFGDPVTARALGSEAIAIFREQRERWGLAWALSYLGMTLRDLEDFSLARSFVEESVVLWQDLGNQSGLAFAIRIRGNIALRQGDYELAQRAFAETLAINRKLSDKVALARALLELGQATLCLDDRIRAKTCFQESFEMFRQIGHKSWQVTCLYYFGLLAQSEGDNQQARIFLEESLVLSHRLGPIWLRANALMGLSGVAAAEGQARRAARLLGAADTQLELGASYWDAAESRYIERAVASAVAQLGEDAFAEAYAEGRAMTFEQAAAHALETEPST